MTENVDTPPVEAMYRALKVITEDARISQWLASNDPKALEQANKAVMDYVLSDTSGENTHVVDCFVKLYIGVCAVKGDDEMAESMALDMLREEHILERIADAIDDSSFYVGDIGETKFEVGRAD